MTIEDGSDQLIALLSKELQRAKAQLESIMVTDVAPDVEDPPERILLETASMSPGEMLRRYKEHIETFDTLPIDNAGDTVRFYRGEWTIWSGWPGAGKCLAKGTPCLMYDGTLKNVEEIAVGDCLIGPDSGPRRVISLARGREMMYRVTPQKGDAYTVNESHVLSLRNSRPNWGGYDKLLNISVREYLQLSKSHRAQLKGWRADGIAWAEKPVPLDPYFLGAWLGDGAISEPIVYGNDPEVLSSCADVALSHGLRAVRFMSGNCGAIRLAGDKGRKNPIYEILRTLEVTKSKHVPLIYKANSQNVRAQILAGLIDTDGSLCHGGFDFVSKIRALAEDVVYLARSLGLAAYCKESYKQCQTVGGGIYWRVSISGDCSIIPTRIPRKQAKARKQLKRVNVTGITVEPVGEGDYYGFELSGADKLFLLGDFTVTHNTTLLRQMACHIMKLMGDGECIFIATLEQDPEWFLIEMAATAAGVQVPTEAQLTTFLDTYGAKLRIWGRIGIGDHKQIFTMIRHLAEKHGCAHAIVDSLMCLDVDSTNNEAQRQFANLVSATARAKRVHLHLVAHPRKPVAPDQAPNVWDVAGSSDLGRLAFNVLFVRRGPEEASTPGITNMLVHVVKQRTYGKVGEITGYFYREQGQFHVDPYAQEPTRYLPEHHYAPKGMMDDVPFKNPAPPPSNMDWENF